MTSPLPIECRSARDVSSALAGVDRSRAERAAAEGRARPIDYALGSGEADEVALYAGLKPLVRQVLDAEGAAAARARFAALGLTVGETVHRAERSSARGVVLFAGRDPDRVRDALGCEGEPDHDRELGRLLGYPRCCVDAYLAAPAPRGNSDVLARAARATETLFEPRLNTLDLAVFHYVSWLPCSFSCSLSKAFANAVAHHISKRHGQFVGGRGESRKTCPPRCRHERFVADVDRALSTHRLMILEDVQVAIEGTFDGSVLRVDRAWPASRDRAPDAPVEEEALVASARLAALVETAERLAVREGVLYVGDAPVLASEEALLAPFGGTSRAIVEAR